MTSEEEIVQRGGGAGLAGLLLGLAALLGLPAWVASQAMNDGELDHITASGRPTIVSVGNNSAVDFVEATDIALYIGSNSQAGLRALVLNNVAGENQIANGINISAGTSATDKQGNSIVQSWGAVKDLTSVVVAGDDTAQTLSTTADQIVTAGGGPIIFSPSLAIAMGIESNAQTGLMALVVNNVAGLNQVAIAANVKGGTTGLADGGLVIGAGVGPVSWQSNQTNQFRGTPANFMR